MLAALHWKLGHPGHGNLSHPSVWCDAHATQHRATFVPPFPSPEHLYITCTDTVYNGDYTSQMILEAEPVDIYTANPTTHSKHTNSVTKSLHLWLGLHITQQFVCCKTHQASASYCLCWSGPPAGPSIVTPLTSYPTTLYQTEPNKTQANIM